MIMIRSLIYYYRRKRGLHVDEQPQNIVIEQKLLKKEKFKCQYLEEIV